MESAALNSCEATREKSFEQKHAHILYCALRVDLALTWHPQCLLPHLLQATKRNNVIVTNQISRVHGGRSASGHVHRQGPQAQERTVHDDDANE